MAVGLRNEAFLADLTARIHDQCEQVETLFLPLSERQLNWQPSPKEWSILQCVDHLNKTNRFYMGRIKRALQAARPTSGGPDDYKPSFWAGVYIRFAFNPRLSFPSPRQSVPESTLNLDTLTDYLAFQDNLLSLMKGVRNVSLTMTRTPLFKGITYNLGDYLKVLIYHDGLHMGQARRVLTTMMSAGV